MEPVVAGQRYDTAVRGAHGEKDWNGRVEPNVRIEQFAQVRLHIELEAEAGARQKPAANAEHKQNKIGKEARKVGQLASVGDAAMQVEEDNRPGYGQTNGQLPYN